MFTAKEAIKMTEENSVAMISEYMTNTIEPAIKLLPSADFEFVISLPFLVMKFGN
ncbi:hypothetical protein Ah1_00255 [Aeromonas phage Ah1]|uniref:Uncharacterized protein n=1 Tax=Aeromonas phage Ah1 TaxID=2053701 RepID=A0A2H4YF38_9CAUD|nr:hypothetical protein KNT77_gp263 [Aeromonas phage Ah1]AUE22773.1 hypothetical protein Ah1_00255 [Aeromonas phage Ah1]